MAQLIAIAALLAAFYALWIVGRPDALRLVRGVRHVRAQVIRHDHTRDGFVAIYGFETDGRCHEARAFVAQARPAPPVGTQIMLGHPRGRPDLARPHQIFGRSILYAGFAAWIAVFGDLAFGWF